MLDDLLELVLELVVEGAIGAARSKGLPAPVRLALAGILLLLGIWAESYVNQKVISWIFTFLS